MLSLKSCSINWSGEGGEKRVLFSASIKSAFLEKIEKKAWKKKVVITVHKYYYYHFREEAKNQRFHLLSLDAVSYKIKIYEEVRDYLMSLSFYTCAMLYDCQRLILYQPHNFSCSLFASKNVHTVPLTFLQYSRHKLYVNNYLKYYGGSMEDFKRDR